MGEAGMTRSELHARRRMWAGVLDRPWRADKRGMVYDDAGHAVAAFRYASDAEFVTAAVNDYGRLLNIAGDGIRKP